MGKLDGQVPLVTGGNRGINSILNIGDGDICACLCPHVPLVDVAHDDADLLVLRKERLGDDPARIPRSTKNSKHWRASWLFASPMIGSISGLASRVDWRRRWPGSRHIPSVRSLETSRRGYLNSISLMSIDTTTGVGAVPPSG